MLKSVLSWWVPGVKGMREETVGPSLEDCWVVVMMGTEKDLANLRSLVVVRTLNYVSLWCLKSVQGWRYDEVETYTLSNS